MTIFRKELREIFRDRRTVLGVVIGPLLITPLLFALLGLVTTGQAEKRRARTYAVGIVGAAAPDLERALRATPNLRFQSVERQRAEGLIRSRALHAVVVLPPDASVFPRASRTLPVQILQDAGSDNSREASGLLKQTLARLGERAAHQRLRARGLPADYATPFEVTEAPVAGGGSLATLLLSAIVPYTLVLGAFTGGIYAAFDQVAGEKERGTLETLLVSPASRRDIVLGKFGAVVGVCLVSSVLSLVGLVIPFVSGFKAFDWLSAGGVRFGAPAVLVVLSVLLPLSVLFAGLLLAVSTFARNQKEAQTYLGSLFPLVLAPAMIGMILGAEGAAWPLALIPILNTSLIIKQALAASYDGAFIALAFAASAVYAAGALAFATRLFQRESVLTKT
jgi:sodium transport system permease protein